MLKFLKFVAGSIIGGMVGAFASVFILISIFSAIFYLAGSGAGGDDELQMVPKDSILVVDLSSSYGEFSPDGFSSSYATQNIHDFKRVLTDAAEDDTVSSLLIKAGPGLEIGWSKATDIRKALLEFKKSGKAINTFADVLDEKSLYVVSASNKIYMHSTGEISWNK